MANCQYISRLEAYRDGELSSAESSALEQHLPDCDECPAELQRIDDFAALIGHRQIAVMTPLELARLHRAIDRVEERSFFRFAVGMSGIAASILIISAAWLYDGPRQMPMIQPAAHMEQTWEHLASTGDVQKLPQDVPQTGVAAGNNVDLQDTTDWMVLGTGGHRTHGNP